MITHIRMKNFKSWKDSGEVKLAPLTGFFGTNSSGKSSLLQMLLLLKQTIGTNEILFFGDETSDVNLGNFKELIHEHNLDELLELEFGCKLENSFDIEITDYDKYNSVKSYQLNVDSFRFNVTILEESGILKVESCSYTFGIDKDFKIKWEKSRLFIGIQSDRYGVVSSFYQLSRNIQDDMLYNFPNSLEDQFDSIKYIGPTRVNPQRLYHWEGDHPEEIGRFGDKTIDALLSARVDRKTTLHDEEKVSIEERISQWLREMNLAHTFILERTKQQDGKKYDVRIQMKEDGPKIALADMGYGLSQFLPVLVLCYYVPEGSTLILEQPGIHLHPMVQAQLADLLIEVVNERNLQILVESHSEYLVTRLQRRIVEKQIAQDDVALYFCRNNDGASTIEKLDVDEGSGDIINWPENFFGNVMGDMFAMTDKEVERIAEKEPES